MMLKAWKETVKKRPGTVLRRPPALEKRPVLRQLPEEGTRLVPLHLIQQKGDQRRLGLPGGVLCQEMAVQRGLAQIPGRGQAAEHPLQQADGLGAVLFRQRQLQRRGEHRVV